MRNSGNRMWTVLVAPLLTLVTLCGLASPAHAVGDVTRPDISGCFTWGGGVPYAGAQVGLVYWNSRTLKVVQTRAATTNSAGCIRFNDIAPGHYYRLEAFTNFTWQCYYYYGVSDWIVSGRGDAHYRVGTSYAYGPYSYAC